MRKRLKITEKLPHIVRLPKNSTGAYGRFDIVQQTKVVNIFSPNPTIVRCQEPFILKVTVNGKSREIKSRKE